MDEQKENATVWASLWEAWEVLTVVVFCLAMIVALIGQFNPDVFQTYTTATQSEGY